MKKISLIVLLVASLAFSSCQGCSKSGRKKMLNGNDPKAHNKRERIDPKIYETSGKHEKPEQEAVTKDIADIAEDAEPCVFIIFCHDEQGETLKQGTGFFIKGNGTAVSNFHVFEGGSSWVIQTNDNMIHEVNQILKQDADLDYIVFNVKGNSTFPYLKIAKTKPRKGDEIVVIGNPMGLENTITKGIVSSYREYENKDGYMQIDAAISPGSSGSPVLDMSGRVVGIATLKILDCENCNFALTITMIEY